MVSFRLKSPHRWLAAILVLLLVAFLGHFVFEATVLDAGAPMVPDLHSSILLLFTATALWPVFRHCPLPPTSHSLSLWSACPLTPPPILYT